MVDPGINLIDCVIIEVIDLLNKYGYEHKDVIRYYKNNWNLGETIVEINTK